MGASSECWKKPRPAAPGTLAGHAAGGTDLRVAGARAGGGQGRAPLEAFGGLLELVQQVQQGQGRRRIPRRRGRGFFQELLGESSG
ncbi:hypothetical protein GCM10020254_06810 [Streptomyces goshikiensis]